MISETSKRCFISVINVCYTLNVIPYKIVTPRKNGVIQLKISPKFKWYKINTIWNLSCLFGVAILLIYRIVKNNFEPLLTTLVVGMLTLITFVATYQILLFMKYQDLLVDLNGNHAVQFKLGKLRV